jgi:hypothetical protein
MTSTTPRNGKNSLTFESIVCTQLELQRRAASFSNRRSTMCRRSTQYPFSSSSPKRLSTLSNRILLLTPSPVSTPYSSDRISTSDISTQFSKTRNSRSSRYSRTSSTNSGGGRSSVTDRQSFVSMFYWDGSPRSPTCKKV